jgi:SAM-dependent methyltransferase
MAATSKRKRKQGWRTAATSDRNELYELSVQDPSQEIALIQKVWREIRGRKPTRIREDFCGSAAVSAAWVQVGPRHTAIGVDLDPKVLAWAKKRHVEPLTEAQKSRLTLIKGNVLNTKTPPIDSVLAMNFSCFVFKTRPEMIGYMRGVRKSLVKDGIFILDCYGGGESWLEMEEERDLDGFTYVWDQRHINPISHHVTNHIHFRFPDGSEMKKAFTYQWRLWTIPELREMLLEAGFSSVTVYWEGTDHKTQEGNGIFRPTLRGEACRGWIAYLTAAV